MHRTPHVDKLARDGSRFTSFYVSSGVCTPSRASLMTGCFPRRLNMHENATGGPVLMPVSSKGLNPDETTVAEILKSRGYATACIGKWHLGDQPPFLPTRQGFDYFFGLPYSDDMTRERQPETWPELPLMRQEMVIQAPADRDALVKKCTEEAIAFIRRSVTANQPFFLYLPHTMPGSTDQPFSSSGFRGKSRNGAYGDAVEELDWSTGELMKCMDELKIAENTLVIWTSDNGAVQRSPRQGSNEPYQGWGYDTSEGAMRMPCIMRWPGVIPVGTVNDALCSSLDILPTLASETRAAGPVRAIDGHDLSTLIRRPLELASPWDEVGFPYYFMDQLQAVRSGPWKLYLPMREKYMNLAKKGLPAELKLFNVRTDVREMQNVADKHPEIVAKMMRMAEKYRRELGDMDRAGSGQRPAGFVKQPKPIEPVQRENVNGSNRG